MTNEEQEAAAKKAASLVAGTMAMSGLWLNEEQKQHLYLKALEIIRNAAAPPP